MHPLLNNNKISVELKSRRFCYTNEEDSMREELIGQIEMHQQTTNVLYQLLSEACRERDEAKEQLKKSMAEVSELKKLLNKLLPTSNIPSQTNFSHSVPSTSGIGIRPRTSRTSFVGDPACSRVPIGDCSSNGKVIDTLIKGKPLPEIGRLVEAVVDTPPLLETILLTGQLPTWRNPPPLPFNLVGGDNLTGFQTLNYKKSHDHNIL